MTTARLNLGLGLLLLAVLAGNLLLRANPERPRPFWLLSNMAQPVPAESFAANPLLPGGQVNQPPQPDTLPRGPLPPRYGPGPDEAQRAGRELTSPVRPEDALALARGELGFNTYCAPCHGGGGTGDGAVAQAGFPPPPSLLADHARGLPDGQFWHIITHGQGNMPPHAAQVPQDERWQIVRYIRKLQGVQP